MTIKGIDSQIALQRSTDLVRETQNQLKRNDLNQDFLAVKSKLDADRQELQVQHLTEKEKSFFNPEKERENPQQEAAGSESESRKQGGKNNQGQTEEERLAVLIEKGLISKSKIDIRV